jgi:protein gp37
MMGRNTGIARPERAKEYFSQPNGIGFDMPSKKVPRNCWIGTTIGVKASLNRLDILRSIPARIRFLSCEPLLEDLGKINLEGISWVIVGGESDPDAPRPMKSEWAWNIINQCKACKVPVFFKQMGGKGTGGAGGNLLDGKQIQEYPMV